jgi:hypothetical protein
MKANNFKLLAYRQQRIADSLSQQLHRFLCQEMVTTATNISNLHIKVKLFCYMHGVGGGIAPSHS